MPGIGAELAAVIVLKLKEVEGAAASTGKKRLVLKPLPNPESEAFKLARSHRSDIFGFYRMPCQAPQLVAATYLGSSPECTACGRAVPLMRGLGADNVTPPPQQAA